MITIASIAWPIRAISLDLDDTLWPIVPTIQRAEAVLRTWLAENAPATAQFAADPSVAKAAREHIQTQYAHLLHDFTVLRRESIRYLLTQAGDDPALAEPAFEAFFAARQDVQLYDDALPALQAMSARYPLIALTNGNADLERVGLAPYFKACISARAFGVAKPHPSIYAAAAQAAGVPNEAVLHVGDDAQLDVQGALQAGQHAAWINRDAKPWPAELPALPAKALTLPNLGALVQALGL